MQGQAWPAAHQRWFSVACIALPMAALILCVAGIIPIRPGFPAFLVALTSAGMLAVGLVADAPRLQSGISRALIDHDPGLPAHSRPSRTRVLIVGAGPSARRAAQELESTEEHEVIGFVSDDRLGNSDRSRVLGNTEDIPTLVRRLGIQRVIVAEVPAWQQQLNDMLCTSSGEQAGAPPRVDVHVVPGLYEARMGRLQFHRVRDLPLVHLAPAQPSPVSLAVKRCFDLIVAGLALVVTAPAVGIAALAIKLTSPGAVFFRQERVGKGGRSFTIYKLRTMVSDAEKHTGPVLSAGASDARITPLGRILRATRLDELPQLVNVLRGEMSIVGPRPERPCFVNRYNGEIPGYLERHQVLPGITGLAQVNGGYAIDAEMKLRYDLLYIYNWSPWLDAKVMLQTLLTVCRRTGQ